MGRNTTSAPTAVRICEAPNERPPMSEVRGRQHRSRFTRKIERGHTPQTQVQKMRLQVEDRGKDRKMILGLLIGFIIGTLVGIVVGALLRAAKEGEE